MEAGAQQELLRKHQEELEEDQEKLVKQQALLG